MKVAFGVLPSTGRVTFHLHPANMAQSKRTCESAYEDGFMAAWAETDVGEITAH